MLHLSGKTFYVVFGYSSSLCGPFAYHPSAIPSDNHTNEGSCLLREEWASWTQVKCRLLAWEHTFSFLLLLLLLFFQIKAGLQVSYLSTGQRLCSVLPLDSHKNCWKAFFNCISLQTSQKSSSLFQDIQSQGHHYMAHIHLHSCLCLNNLTLYCLALPFYLFPFLWCIWMQLMNQKQGWGLGGSHW